MNPLELLRHAGALGLRLEYRGSKLAVIPKGKCPPEFADVLRAHKPELLSWLEGRTARLCEDEIPWGACCPANPSRRVRRRGPLNPGEFDDWTAGDPACGLPTGLGANRCHVFQRMNRFRFGLRGV